MSERIFRFRAWHKSTCQMAEVVDNDLSRLEADEYEIMQYIGLKDKNGKEIYEGDIVKINDKILEVFFEGGAFGITNLDFTVAASFFSMLRGDEKSLKKIEIIGNIYEHPHLLEGGK